MILPQPEARATHGADVVVLFLFDDNAHILCQGDPLGERAFTSIVSRMCTKPSAATRPDLVINL
jgi:hypothetical protein